MLTSIQNKNRLTDDACCTDLDMTTSLDSILWHIAIHDKLSEHDRNLFKLFAPNNSSLFVLKNDNLIFVSEELSETISTIFSEISLSYEATFVQHLHENKDGSLRILTIPLDENILIGLVSPTNVKSLTETEDIFLHKVHLLQNEYAKLKSSIDDLLLLTKSTNPTLVINRSDDRIIAWNKQALSFFNISENNIIETQLQSLQKNCPKTTKRKMTLKNCTIVNSEFSVIQFTLTTSDIQKSDTITDELKTHAEYLLACYQELQIPKKLNEHFIESKIVEINRCYQNIMQLQNSEKK